MVSGPNLPLPGGHQKAPPSSPACPLRVPCIFPSSMLVTFLFWASAATFQRLKPHPSSGKTAPGRTAPRIPYLLDLISNLSSMIAALCCLQSPHTLPQSTQPELRPPAGAGGTSEPPEPPAPASHSRQASYACAELPWSSDCPESTLPLPPKGNFILIWPFPTHSIDPSPVSARPENGPCPKRGSSVYMPVYRETNDKFH